MNSTVVAGSALAALLMAAPLHAQLVSADVVVRTGPVRGHVVIGDGYSSYAHRPVIVREPPARVIVVERFRGHGHHKHWKRHGYRQVTVYHLGGRYYDRHRPGAHKITMYERGGRYFDACDDCRRHDRDDRRRDDYRDRDNSRDRDDRRSDRHDRRRD